MSSPVNKIITKIIISFPKSICDLDNINITIADKNNYIANKVGQIDEENIYYLSYCELNKSSKIIIDVNSIINYGTPKRVGLWSYDFNRDYIKYCLPKDEKTYSTYFGLTKNKGSITLFTFDILTLLLLLKEFLRSNDYPTDLVYPLINYYYIL